MHEEALATMEATSSRDGVVERAELFFREAITPIEKIHNTALQASAHLNRVHKKLERRTVDLAASARSLKKSIVRRKTIEAALKESGGHTKKLLEESDRLQKNLRHLTHQLLMVQEDKRKKISKELQDEIAQTLLGISVRLLTLKKEAAVNAEDFKQHIASTQRLVDHSVRSINRFAHEFGKKHEA
jgi:signal transduction histidine kinase